MRTPEQIVGHDAITQLAFEGYKVVPIFEFSVGDDVADKSARIWKGVVTNIKPIESGIGMPGIATVDSGRNEPQQWNVTRLFKTERPEFVDWPLPK